MKYRNLKITFDIDNTEFTVLSIGSEQFDRPIPKHAHSKNSYELHYISSGRGTLIVNMEKYDIYPGSFYVTGPGINHEQTPDIKDPMTEYGIYLKISTDGVIPPNNPVDIFTKTPFFIGQVDDEISLLLHKILEELSEQPFEYEYALPPLLKYLIVLITRLYTHDGVSFAGKKIIQLQDMLYLTIEEAFLYEYSDLTLESLAGKLGLGIRQTERLLRKHYSKTFSQMKCDARMSAASLLLTESTKSIGEIAQKLGYSSSEHFTNAFKKYYNSTPTGYRNTASNFPEK